MISETTGDVDSSFQANERTWFGLSIDITTFPLCCVISFDNNTAIWFTGNSALRFGMLAITMIRKVEAVGSTVSDAFTWKSIVMIDLF